MKKIVLALNANETNCIEMLYFLLYIEEHINKPLYTIVDFMAGNEYGGIIACCISIGMSIEDILQIVLNESILTSFYSETKWLYHIGLSSRYNDKPKKKILNTMFQDTTIHDVSIPLIIPTYNKTKNTLFCWSSYDLCNGYLKDILLASTATTRLFPYVRIPLIKPKQIETKMNLFQRILPHKNDSYMSLSEVELSTLTYIASNHVYPEDTTTLIYIDMNQTSVIHPIQQLWYEECLINNSESSSFNNITDLKDWLGDQFIYCIPTCTHTSSYKQKAEYMWNDYKHIITDTFNP